MGLAVRQKKSKELPEYSALTSRPTRELPPELAEDERSEELGDRREAIQRELLQEPRRPSLDSPLFTAFLSEEGRGVVTMNLPGDAGRCLPVFTSPMRAADYRQVLLAGGATTQYLSCTPVQFVKMLRDVEEVGIRKLTVDRCPRCAVLTVLGSRSVKTPDDMVTVWSIHKAGEIAREQAYFAYAIQAARAGRLDVAREVALEAVGHVTIEEPRAHMLLGQVAIGLADRTLLREAGAFLAFLNQSPWQRKLEESARAGSPDFTSWSEQE